MTENISNCMTLIDYATKVVDGLENEEQFIMMIGTMSDKWFASHNVTEEDAVRILEKLVEIHKLVYDMVGGMV